MKIEMYYSMPYYSKVGIKWQNLWNKKNAALIVLKSDLVV